MINEKENKRKFKEGITVYKTMYKEFGISDKIIDLSKEVEKDIETVLKKIE